MRKAGLAPPGWLVLLGLLGSLASGAEANMKVSSFDGAVTAEELQSFNNYIATLEPASDNVGNNWAQGHSGEQTKAMGLVYLMAGQQDTLDNMLWFCDAVLSERNDIAKAPVGQHEVWTGGIDPVWPNDVDSEPVSTEGAQGDPVGHLASCANLILRNETLYDLKPSIGDDYGYGATYKERAQTYVDQADYAMSKHILSRLLDLSHDNKMYFASDGPYKPGDAVPWNQQMMFNYAFQNLADAHRILKDNATLRNTYKNLVFASLDWFFEGGGSTNKTSEAGSTYYDWDYAVGGSVEDSNHGSLDVAGFYRAYVDQNYAITSEQMKPFANMFVDVMTLGNGSYAGTVEGGCKSSHAACIDYIRSGYLLLAEFRPDAYEDMMGADLEEGGTTTSTDVFSRFLWVKNQRARNS
ncbi:hypothetical protein F5Y15DRAFT_370398 [Xylariaceae sp. FL0016]|nr:hypothetical protein F5Y15DRAFT_370398 [Xylariaceae sp. FL0016]